MSTDGLATDPPTGFLWPANTDWARHLQPWRQSAEFQQLNRFVTGRRQQSEVFPAAGQVFRALQLTPLEDVRFVILGQDPYHGAGQADGLSFSVPAGVKCPPSLRNIFRELTSDIGCPPPGQGDLQPWTEQGGLLLNSVLTVDAGQAHSHRNRGWELLTDRIINLISRQCERVAFVFWGNAARQKRVLVESTEHLIVTAPHPSPLSAHRGFFGTRPFSRINDYRRQHRLKPIDWRL